MIVFCAIGTFILLKLVGLFVPLRMTEEEMEEGDVAVHGHEVYPSDVPSLGYPDGIRRWLRAAGSDGRRRVGRWASGQAPLAATRFRHGTAPATLRGRFPFGGRFGA